MTRNLRFHPLATAEVVEAQLWYEDRINGLGTRFLGAVRATTDRASRWPNTGTPTRHDHSGHPIERKVVVAGFPYVVVYRLADDDLEILAVHHEHRRPFYWTDRATERLDNPNRRRSPHITLSTRHQTGSTYRHVSGAVRATGRARNALTEGDPRDSTRCAGSRAASAPGGGADLRASVGAAALAARTDGN